MREKARRPIAAALGVFLLTICGCGPSDNAGRHAGGLFGLHRHALPLMTRALRLGLRGTRAGGFRRACEGDAARLCANVRPGREERLCLDEKRDQLSTDCRAALDARARRNNQTR